MQSVLRMPSGRKRLSDSSSLRCVCLLTPNRTDRGIRSIGYLLSRGLQLRDSPSTQARIEYIRYEPVNHPAQSVGVCLS